MNKTECTPGPWLSSSRINFHDQGLVISEKTGENVAVTYKGEDASLIAAALELLEALHSIWVNIPSSVLAQHGLSEIEILTLIRKAKGEPSC